MTTVDELMDMHDKVVVAWRKVDRGQISSETAGKLDAAFRSALQEVVGDAGRYQWLCANKHMPWGAVLPPGLVVEGGIDQAVDAAMKAQETGG